jgi:DNA-binding NarL/FixJ family response regulator
LDRVIRVVLVDDHPALRLGLKVLLERAPDVELVGEAEEGQEALALVEASQPDVIVLDCELPGLSGIQVAQEIQRQGLPTQIVALSAYDSDRYVRGMLDAGARGYLLKEEAPETVVTAVRAVAGGQEDYSQQVMSKVMTWARGERPGGLTEREVEVLRLVAEGLSNKEIAYKLQVVERTVQFHVSNILQKLHAASRVEAAVWAKEQGIIP